MYPSITIVLLFVKVLKEEGLRGIVDPQMVQKEIADATNVTPADLNKAAKEVSMANATNGHQSTPPAFVRQDSKRRGFTIQDMRDFNNQQRKKPGNANSKNVVIDFT